MPGTTRDVIEVPLAIGGVPFVLVDTAGLRDSDDAVERIGDRARASARLRSADILLWLGEPDAAPQHRSLIMLARPSRPGGAGAARIAGGVGRDWRRDLTS